TIYLDRWQWDRLAAAMDVYDTISGAPDPRGEALRERLRLAVRQPGAAAQSSPATATIARALLTGREVAPASSAVTADADGAGRLDLVSVEGQELVIRDADTLRAIARRPYSGPRDLHCAGRDDRGAYAVAMPAGGGDGLLVPLDGSPTVPLGPLGLSGFPQ